MLTVANPTFVAYVVSLLVLTAHLTFLWCWSGVVRGTTKTAINPEDGRPTTTVVDADPPAVARVIRAHKNGQVNVVPFLFVGLVFVCLGGAPTLGVVLFAVFTVSRLLHSVAYLVGKQPWRSIFFGTGALATVVMLVDCVVLLAKSRA